MPKATWTIRFGFHPNGPTGPEYYALIEDKQGHPVDTFYGGIEDVFEGVGMLMASHASGTGLGAPAPRDLTGLYAKGQARTPDDLREIDGSGNFTHYGPVAASPDTHPEEKR